MGHTPLLAMLSELLFLHRWYWPDYQYGGYLSWGRGMGCGFINDSCWAWINQHGLDRYTLDSTTNMACVASPPAGLVCGHSVLRETTSPCLAVLLAGGLSAIVGQKSMSSPSQDSFRWVWLWPPNYPDHYTCVDSIGETLP